MRFALCDAVLIVAFLHTTQKQPNSHETAQRKQPKKLINFIFNESAAQAAQQSNDVEHFSIRISIEIEHFNASFDS